jgi:hypothetical protein
MRAYELMDFRFLASSMLQTDTLKAISAVKIVAEGKVMA